MASRISRSSDSGNVPATGDTQVEAWGDTAAWCKLDPRFPAYAAAPQPCSSGGREQEEVRVSMPGLRFLLIGRLTESELSSFKHFFGRNSPALLPEHQGYPSD